MIPAPEDLKIDVQSRGEFGDWLLIRLTHIPTNLSVEGEGIPGQLQESLLKKLCALIDEKTKNRE